MNAPVPEPETVPEELRDREQWLMWDAAADAPRRPHWRGDFSVSWSDPEDWHSFEDAVEAASERESWGIGYVFARTNDNHARGLYGALDIDGCVDESGPKEWLPSLQPFFDHGAWMEFSPSEGGVHVPLAGFEPPEWWSDSHFTDDEHEGVEAYGSKFFTFTGNMVRNSGEAVAETGDWVEEWLVQAHKAITGDDPRTRDGTGTGEEPDRDYASGGGWFDAETAKDALNYIDPDVTYSTWRDIGFALADEFPSTTALSLFTEWSRRGSKWDADAEKQAERIIDDASPGGGRTVATVIYHARQGGWSIPDGGTDSATTDGGATAESADAGGPATETRARPLTPMSVMAVAGLSEDDSLADLTDREKAFFVHQLIDDHADEHLLAAQPDGTLFHFDGGVWVPRGEQRLRELGRRALGPAYSKNVHTELCEHVRAATPVERDDMGVPTGTIAVENGLVTLENREVRDLRPDDHALTRLPVEYDPDAPYVEWAGLVDEWAEDGKADALQEYVGYCLHVGALPIHRALLLVGSGANGKGTFLHVVRQLLGRENTTSIELQTLANEKDAVADFHGSLANIDDDLSARKLGQGKGMFKKLIGGDRVRARRLYQDGFEFDATGKHLYAANKVPQVNVPDDDEAFWRRWLLVEFPNYYPPAERDPELRDRLTDPNGLSGVLNWAIEGWRRLLDQGSFTNEERLDHDKRTRWQSWGDSVDRFISECVEHDPDADRLSTHDAYRRYEAWCRENEEESVGQRNFTNTLKDENVGYGKHRIDGTSTLGYTELGFSDDVPGHGDEERNSESSSFFVTEDDI